MLKKVVPTTEPCFSLTFLLIFKFAKLKWISKYPFVNYRAKLNLNIENYWIFCSPKFSIHFLFDIQMTIELQIAN